MLLFLIWFNLLSQQKQVDIYYTHDFFEVDHFGYIYAVNDSEIVKFNSTGKKLYTYSNSSLGSIYSIDVSNPLRILLFYKDFNQILFLDQTLSPIGATIDLYEFSNDETELVCSSLKGGFWIYNSNENQSFHISSKGEKLSESILINSIYNSLSVSKIKEYNNNLYLLFDNQNILQLNQDGQFIAKIHIPKNNALAFYKNSFQYVKNKSVFAYRAHSSSDSLLYKIPDNEFKNAILISDKIYLSNEKSISIRNISF